MVLESPESSSPTVTRAVSASLRGLNHTTYTIQPWQRLTLKLLGYLPQDVARYVISRFQSLSGIDPGRLNGLKLDQVIATRLQDYASITEKFDTITIGAALGGASAHLSLSMRSLFLPVAFVFTLRGGSPAGDIRSYYNLSADLALQIANTNPEVITVQHFDPIHDGWLTRYVNQLRLKLITLPPAYAAFIRRYLRPGGTLCYLDCGAQWLRYRVGERSYLQVGGWGDISPNEFLDGSPRIKHYRRSARLNELDWKLPGFNIERGSESEWGCESALADSLREFCQLNGFRFIDIKLPEPHDYSRLAYHAVTQQIMTEGRSPNGVLVEMFSQFDSTSVMKSSLLPLWLIFNTMDSKVFLSDMLDQFPPDKPVFFSPLVTFSQTPDLVPWDEWQSALAKFKWINIGTRSTHYPADSWTLLEWEKPLWNWVESNPSPIRSVLDPRELQELSSSINPLVKPVNI